MLMKLRSRMQRTNNQKGFTLVELMVVVVILGILVAIAVPVYNSVTNNANKRAVEANLRTIDGAIMQQQANTEAAAAPTQAFLENSYLQSWPKGPGTVTYKISGAAPYVAQAVLTANIFGTTVTEGDKSLKDLKAAASGW